MIITTTTCDCRAELLNQTYKSWIENLRGIDIASIPLFLNIDSYNHDCSQCIDVANRYFKSVITYYPEQASFQAAIKRLWTNQSDYIIHLEDDWLLMYKTDIDELFKLFNNETYQVGFRAYERPNAFRDFILAPNIIKGSVANKVAEIINVDSLLCNPEQQIRMLGKYNHSRVYPLEQKIIIQDIGRDWLANSKYRRNNTELTFTGYVEGSGIIELANQSAQAKANREQYEHQ
jgi:hypothetical protein